MSEDPNDSKTESQRQCLRNTKTPTETRLETKKAVRQAKSR